MLCIFGINVSERLVPSYDPNSLPKKTHTWAWDFFHGGGLAKFSEGVQFFCEEFFSPKRGVKGWVKFFLRKMSKIYRF